MSRHEPMYKLTCKHCGEVFYYVEDSEYEVWSPEETRWHLQEKHPEIDELHREKAARKMIDECFDFDWCYGEE